MENKKINIEEQIQMELHDMLSKDNIKVVINKEFDIPVYVPTENKKYKKILVMSGGAVKGISYIGALQALSDLKYLDKFDEFACTSVAALAIGMYLIGYTPNEMWKFTTKFDYTVVKNIQILNIVNEYGVDNGEKMEYMLKRLIVDKGYDEDITLRDLFFKTNKKFTVTSVCVNDMKVEYISHENYPNLSLYKAIRMSISIPMFYAPYKYNNKLYVDGGWMDNYPIGIYSNQLDDVLGLYIRSNDEINENINDFESYSYSVYRCFMKALMIKDTITFSKYTINIIVEVINGTNFELNDDQKLKLYNTGYKAVTDYF